MEDELVNPRRRLTRAEAKVRTREQLLEAAARVFAHKGYAGASVEEIAESAGYSTGALYSNFDSKEQLFLELKPRTSAKLPEVCVSECRKNTWTRPARAAQNGSWQARGPAIKLKGQP